MQDLKGRSTTVTEGNAKGDYVSYVIEEDVSETDLSDFVSDIYSRV